MNTEQIISTPLPLTDLDLVPQYPDQITLISELLQTVALLCGWDGKARKLLRCDDIGGLCVSPMRGQFRKNTFITQLTVQNTWTTISGIPADCMAVEIGSPSYATNVRVYTVSGGDYYTLLIPPNRTIEIPHKVGGLTVNTWPNATGTATTIGIACFQPNRTGDYYK